MSIPKRDDIRGDIWDINLIPDQTGKVALVTGANVISGIGWNTANELAKKGAHVIIHARSEDKAQTAIDEILKQTPTVKKENLSSFIAEFSDLKGLKKVAGELASKLDRLDLLVNNAGLLARKLDKDDNGISVSIVTNHLAPFVLTTTLLPLLKKTATLPNADVRIIALSSTTHTLIPGSVRFRNLDDFNVSFGAEDGMPANIQRYGLSKLATLLTAKQLQAQFDAENIPIISIAVHPGGVRTPGAVKFIEGSLGGNKAALESGLTPLQGAVTSLFAATSPDVRKEKSKYAGKYLMPFGVPSEADETADAKNPELAKELWATTEKVVADVLAK